MSTKIKSVFGAYADRLQVIIDNNLNRFAPTWYQNYFRWGVPQLSLTFTDVIGRKRIEAAASVIEPDSPAPLRSRPNLEKLSGEIPTFAEKFRMSEKDYRDFWTLQQLSIGNNEDLQRQQLLDLLWNDVENAGNSLNKRLDYMALEGVSTGQITLTTTNNPDGIVAPNAISLLMPSANKVNAGTNWNTTASAKPFADIKNITQLAAAKGIKHAKILMTRDSWYAMTQTDEVIKTLSSFFRLTLNQTYPTLNNVNEYLRSQDWPIIEIVDVSIGIEKDGVITATNPFSNTNVVFVPEGQIGMVHNAIPMEQLQPVGTVSYATFNRGLISKWSENEPFNEWTKGEMKAFPMVTAIDSIYHLSRTAAFV